MTKVRSSGAVFWVPSRILATSKGGGVDFPVPMRKKSHLLTFWLETKHMKLQA